MTYLEGTAYGFRWGGAEVVRRASNKTPGRDWVMLEVRGRRRSTWVLVVVNPGGSMHVVTSGFVAVNGRRSGKR